MYCVLKSQINGKPWLVLPANTERDITRIANRVGGDHRVMIKTSQDYRCCVWVLKDVKIEKDALYLHIWDYKTLSFYSKGRESEYVF